MGDRDPDPFSPEVLQSGTTLKKPVRPKTARIYPIAALCRDAGLPKPFAEYRFHPERKWRFDFAWPEYKIAVEIDGGAFVAGRHTRGAGYLADMERSNAAVMLGWRVLRYPPKLVGGRITADLSEMIQTYDPDPATRYG